MRRQTRRQRQAETRAALLRAAASVILEHGVDGSTVEEITAEAGFSRGAFYSNFDSKEQLLIELLRERGCPDNGGLGAGAAERTRTSQRRINEQLTESRGRPADRSLPLLWLECIAQAPRSAQCREFLCTALRGHRSALTEVASRGGARDSEAKSIAAGLVALEIGIALQHIMDPGEIPLGEYNEIFELLLTASRRS